MSAHSVSKHLYYISILHHTRCAAAADASTATQSMSISTGLQGGYHGCRTCWVGTRDLDAHKNCSHRFTHIFGIRYSTLKLGGVAADQPREGMCPAGVFVVSLDAHCEYLVVAGVWYLV